MNYWFLTAALAALLANPTFAQSQATIPASNVETTSEQALSLETLQDRIKILERKLEIQEDEAEAKRQNPSPSTQAEPGFGFKSGNGDFAIRFKGILDTDYRAFLTETNKGSSTFLLRSVRPFIEGTLYKFIDYRFMPDFGNGTVIVQDAFAEAKFSPAFKVRTGKFKISVGLERLQGEVESRFAERGFPSSFLPNRDTGVQVQGDSGNLNYTVGIFNGQADNTTTDGDSNYSKDIAARIFATPFIDSEDPNLEGFGIGLGYSYGDQTGSTLSSYRSIGQRPIFSYTTGSVATGTRYHLSPQFYYYNGGFGLFGEWAQSSQELQRTTSYNRITHNAWQLHAEWVLTGEDASFKELKIKNPFDPAKGTWGAFELTGRINQALFDQAAFDTGFASATSSVRQATAFGLNLNWYITRNLRYSLGYEHTVFDAGASSGNREDEKLVTFRSHLTF